MCDIVWIDIDIDILVESSYIISQIKVSALFMSAGIESERTNASCKNKVQINIKPYCRAKNKCVCLF